MSDNLKKLESNILHKSKRSEVISKDDFVVKTYTDHPVNEKSSVDREVFFSSQIKSKNILPSQKISERSLKMQRLSFALGTTKKINLSNIRRLLFFLSKNEVIQQFENIRKDLNESNIIHRDVNPNNILFDEKSKTLKLSDFYWSINKGEEFKETPPGLNGAYSKNDSEAISMLINEFNSNVKIVDKEMFEVLKEFEKNVGSYIFGGSSRKLGWAYHIVDIPDWKDKFRVHKTACIKEYQDICNEYSIPKNINILDVGAANGYFSFNSIRDFSPKKIVAYEGDDYVRKFLNDIKRIYNLHEFEVNDKVNENFKLEDNYDVTFLLNVHMWIRKAIGTSGARKVMNEIQKHTKHLFFQTAHKESKGKYLEIELKDYKDIFNYLNSFGYKKVKLISETTVHGGIRYLFHAEN